MTHDRMAPVMGLMMGGMIPLMVHGSVAGTGLAFVLAHVAVAAAAASLALFMPRALAWMRSHAPGRVALTRMTAGLLVGFAAICSHCLITAHGTA